MAEFEQLALDPLVPPVRILRRHPHDQRGEPVVDRWPSGPIRIGPLLAHETAMPAQDRARSEQAMVTQRLGQPAHERGEHGPVRPVHPWPWVAAAQDGDLVPQHEELDILAGGRAAHQQDQPEHLPEDQVQQPQRHVGIMPIRRLPPVIDPARVLEPHRVHGTMDQVPRFVASCPRLVAPRLRVPTICGSRWRRPLNSEVGAFSHSCVAHPTATLIQ